MPIVLEIPAVVELGDVAVVEALDVAAKTHGVAMSTVATTMPAIAASCIVLVFILSSKAVSALGIYWISEMTPGFLRIQSREHPQLNKDGAR